MELIISEYLHQAKKKEFLKGKGSENLKNSL